VIRRTTARVTLRISGARRVLVTVGLRPQVRRVPSNGVVLVTVTRATRRSRVTAVDAVKVNSGTVTVKLPRAR